MACAWPISCIIRPTLPIAHLKSQRGSVRRENLERKEKKDEKKSAQLPDACNLPKNRPRGNFALTLLFTALLYSTYRT